MFDHDPTPIGYDQHCYYCKAHYGIHDGLCASCAGRFCEGVPKQTEAQAQAARNAAQELEE